MNARSDPEALAALLEFHLEAGIDCFLDEGPHDRFAESALLKAAREQARAAPSPLAIPADLRPAPPPVPAPTRTLPSLAGAPEEAALLARELAGGAATLAELETLVGAFEGCALRFSAKNLAFSDGNPEARIMLVGEAPGAEEDRLGKPFVGRSGQLLDRMLAAIGLDRSSVYIANVVPWRPPGNRTPTPQEISTCRPFIERQITLCDPDILVLLGGPATQTLLATKEGILRMRGRWASYRTEKREIRAFATLHPAYLLRQPLQKRLAWRDLRALRKALDGSPAPDA
jgi:DNA polymerase